MDTCRSGTEGLLFPVFAALRYGLSAAQERSLDVSEKGLLIKVHVLVYCCTLSLETVSSSHDKTLKAPRIL